MKVAIEIPDEVARLLAPASGDVSWAVLKAVAIEGYRSGAITPAQVQQMLGLQSRWEVDAFFRRAKVFQDYTMNDLERDLAAVREASR